MPPLWRGSRGRRAPPQPRNGDAALAAEVGAGDDKVAAFDVAEQPASTAQAGGAVALGDGFVGRRRLVVAGGGQQKDAAALLEQASFDLDLLADVTDADPSTLSEALARHPRVFSALYVNMVAAGGKGSEITVWDLDQDDPRAAPLRITRPWPKPQ